MQKSQTRVDPRGIRTSPQLGRDLFSPWCFSAGKRALDLALATLLLIAASPIALVVGIVVKLSSAGPVLFRQRRVGLNGKEFDLLKFRTMHDAAHRLGPGITCRNDPRIFPVGRLLRRWKLDELPQLVNVLRGDMSLVGPRPDLPEFCARLASDQCALLQLRPGVTGAATLVYHDEESLLADRRGAGIVEYYVNELFPAKAQIDLEYARQASLASDLRILGRTITAIVF